MIKKKLAQKAYY